MEEGHRTAGGSALILGLKEKSKKKKKKKKKKKQQQQQCFRRCHQERA
jgi:hypothetical protein